MAASPTLAAAIAASIPQRGPRCGVALLTPTLTDNERRDLTAALDDRAIPASAISKGLATLGHEVPALTLQRHRRRDCTCPR